MSDKKRGVLYGVSVGPGDPEDMTLKAVRVLNEVPVIASVLTKQGNTLGLDIAKGSVDLSNKRILELPFLMSRDAEAVQKNHEEHARLIAGELDAGNDVAMTSLGDISTFSTFSYVRDILVRQGYEVAVIPGVTSFAASAAKLNVSLTNLNDPLVVIPASGMPLDEALGLPGTKVLMKSASKLPEVLQGIRDYGLADRAGLVQNCGLPNEAVFTDIDDPGISSTYFTTIIIGGQS